MTTGTDTTPPPPRNLFGLPLWLVIGLAVVFMVAVLVLAIRNTTREARKSEHDFLSHAEALIWALEAGSRTWAGYEGDTNVLQLLVRETAKLPGTLYLAVIREDGEIIAHSDDALIGQRLRESDRPVYPEGTDLTWREAAFKERPVYEVSRVFRPFTETQADEGMHGHHRMGMRGRKMGMGMGRGGRGMGMMRQRQMAAEADTAGLVVLVGLDQEPFRQALQADIHTTALTAALIGAVGLLGIVALLWANSYRRSRVEVRRLQSEVERSERLSALGNLAAGVAHEIRNPLSTIRGMATFLAKKTPAGGPEEDAAKTLLSEVGRLNNVVSELLEFARPNAAVGGGGDVNEVVRRALRLADADIRDKRVQVVFTPLDEAPRVRLDAERLTQALLNLILNAVQAVPEGGDIALAVTAEGSRRELAVTVRDNGPGMSREVQARIFDPYFTTKPSGTGLGLPIVQQIATNHGGSLSVKSTPGKGSTFTLVLPVS